MKKSIAAIGVALLSAFGAVAQDVPKTETFLGYTYTRFNSATDIPAFSMNGAGGQFAYNFNGWLSGVADIGAVHNGNIGGFHLDSTFTNFTFGPRVSFHFSHLRPYLNTLFGGVYATSSSKINAIAVVDGNLAGLPNEPIIPGQPITARLTTSQTAFAMNLGGGLDIKVSKNFSFRPIGLDYYMTRLQNIRSANDNNQNCLRYTTGFNFTFGAH